MKKLLLLVGKCATGKTTIETILSKDPNYHRLISYTTRPMRSNETDGVDYVFLTDEQFNKVKDSAGLLEETSYVVSGQLFRYGLPKVELSDEKINIAVVNPHGLKQILDSTKDNDDIQIKVIYLLSSLKTRVERYIQRETDANKYQRLVERLVQDEKDFVNLENSLKNSNIKFSLVGNEDISINELVFLVKKLS